VFLAVIRPVESDCVPPVVAFVAGSSVTVHRLDGIEARTMANNNDSTRR
jgi:hypothetical protein